MSLSESLSMILIIKESLRQTNILEMPYQRISTLVGEGGTKLSGGWRPASTNYYCKTPYGNPEILVLDEASTLDTDAEAKIMEEIYKICEDKTLIVIAHRLSTIKGGGRIYKIENTKIK